MGPYVAATTSATATAIGLNVLAKVSKTMIMLLFIVVVIYCCCCLLLLLQNLPPLIGRFVPFAAVAAANCVNIPLMRQRYAHTHTIIN